MSTTHPVDKFVNEKTQATKERKLNDKKEYSELKVIRRDELPTLYKLQLTFSTTGGNAHFKNGCM